jgi:hypothetical protein
MAAPPSYSYGTAATVYGKNPTDSYYALDTAGGGGTTIPGDLTVGGPLLTLGPSATSQVLVEDLSGLKMKITEGSGAGAILQSNAAGITQTPYLVFNSDLLFTNAAGAVQAKFAAAGGLAMASTLSMGLNTIALSPDGSAIFSNAGSGNETTVSCPNGTQTVFTDASANLLSSVSASGVYAPALRCTDQRPVCHGHHYLHDPSVWRTKHPEAVAHPCWILGRCYEL